MSLAERCGALGLLCLLSAVAGPIKHCGRLDTRDQRRLAGHKMSEYRKPAEERGGGEGDVFESDMRLTSRQLYEILQQQQQQMLYDKTGTDRKGGRRRKRKAVAHQSFLWTSRTVPYAFHSQFPEHYQHTVLEAMQFWQKSTCVKFVPRSESVSEYLRHGDYVLFQVGEGCQSSIGRVAMGKQTTEIAEHCNEFGSVTHELGHVLGFYHEQSRPDRDTYVTILRDNIRPGRQHNFLKYSTSEITTDEPYDIGSVMHYGPTYFSKDSASMTIDTADESYRAVMGQRNAPSFIDVKTANDMYACNDKCGVWPECANMGYVGPGCVCVCPTGLTGARCTDVRPSTADCGGVLKAPSGTIESPGYGQGYASLVDCLWLIQGPYDTASITLDMERFELEDDVIQPCAFDWLEIRTQGPHLNGQRFCGEGPTGPVVYRGNGLVLHFHTDDTYTFGGFRLHYTIHSGSLAPSRAGSWSDGPENTAAAEAGEEDGAGSDSEEDGAGSDGEENGAASDRREDDGAVSDWETWTSCSASCGGGWRFRVRTCLRDSCQDTLFEEEACDTHQCAAAGGYGHTTSPWEEATTHAWLYDTDDGLTGEETWYEM